MLAFNLLIVTLLVVLALGALVFWFLGRPILRRVDQACGRIDELHEAHLARDRLEREEEQRLRVDAEKEIDEQFPRIKGGQA